MNDINKFSSWIKPYLPLIINKCVSKIFANQEVECFCAYLVDIKNNVKSKIFSEKCKNSNGQEIQNTNLVQSFNYEIERKMIFCKKCKYSSSPNIIAFEYLGSGLALLLMVSSENKYFFNEKSLLIGELCNSMEKLLYHYKMEYLDSKINKIENLFNSGQKIGINERNGTSFCYSSEIVYCVADGNYTYLYFNNGTRKILSKSLSKIEKNLLQYDFFIKIHKSTIVNKNFITKIHNNTVHMENGLMFEIALRRKCEIKKCLTIL